MEKQLKIIVQRCPQNHHCPAIKVCPVGALSQNGFSAPIIDEKNVLNVVNVLRFVQNQLWF